MSGSLATSWASKPGGRWNFLTSSSGLRCSLGAMCSAYGSGCLSADRPMPATPRRDEAKRQVKARRINVSDLRSVEQGQPPSAGAREWESTGAGAEAGKVRLGYCDGEEGK